jgi:hypothetical protein
VNLTPGLELSLGGHCSNPYPMPRILTLVDCEENGKGELLAFSGQDEGATWLSLKSTRSITLAPGAGLLLAVKDPGHGYRGRRILRVDGGPGDVTFLVAFFKDAFAPESLLKSMALPFPKPFYRVLQGESMVSCRDHSRPAPGELRGSGRWREARGAVLD